MPKIRTPIKDAKPGVDYVQAVGYRCCFIGCDIGSAQDPTAFTVIEKLVEPEPCWGRGFRQRLKPPQYTVVQAFRLRLNIEYTTIVDTIERVFRAPELEGDATLAIDASGVGAPVASMLQQRGLDFHQIHITSGEAVTELDGNRHRVAKSYLVSQLNGAIETGILTFADGLHDMDALRLELEDFQTHYTDAGNMRFESSRKGHDDLVLSTCIAYYLASRGSDFESAVLPIRFEGG